MTIKTRVRVTLAIIFTLMVAHHFWARYEGFLWAQGLYMRAFAVWLPPSLRLLNANLVALVPVAVCFWLVCAYDRALAARRLNLWNTLLGALTHTSMLFVAFCLWNLLLRGVVFLVANSGWKDFWGIFTWVDPLFLTVAVSLVRLILWQIDSCKDEWQELKDKWRWTLGNAVIGERLLQRQKAEDKAKATQKIDEIVRAERDKAVQEYAKRYPACPNPKAHAVPAPKHSGGARSSQVGPVELLGPAPSAPQGDQAPAGRRRRRGWVPASWRTEHKPRTR